jgi:CTP synthase
LDAIKHPGRRVKIAMVGKYTELGDAYISIVESLKHGGIANHAGIDIKWVNAETLEQQKDLEPIFRDVHGIVVPGGFGIRGVEGKIEAIRYARERKIPFLGLCLGLQCAVIEFARNVCKLKGAHSTEFDEGTKHPVIDLMLLQRGIKDKGGTMRLGAYPCKVKKGTLLHNAYQEDLVYERHRHRFEVNNDYRDDLGKAGLIFSGIYQDADLVEVVEIKDHPWFLATQFHPEFKSRPTKPHPIFRDFVKACENRLEEQTTLFNGK